MVNLFQKRIAHLWDALMPGERWYKWGEEDEDSKQEILMFATDVSRDAFEEGVEWANKNPRWSCNMLENELHKRYPFPTVTKWRTGRDGDGDCAWQVRDGVTWYRSITGDGEWRKHASAETVIKARVDLGDFAGAALIADLAANPTE
jgi:hypothetical protein